MEQPVPRHFAGALLARESVYTNHVTKSGGKEVASLLAGALR